MKLKKRKAGRSLELLIASIERALNSNPNATLESPGYLIDRVTKERREHDVLITLKNGHHTSVIAIECRDRSRKISVNEIEGFSTKCQDTKVHQGIVVSPIGFTKGARRKAAHLNIKCLILKDGITNNWLATTGITAVNRKVIHTNFKFILEKGININPSLFTVVSENGNPIDTNVLNSIATRELFNKIADDCTPKRQVMRIKFNITDIRIRDDTTQVLHDILETIAEIEFEITERFIEFSTHNYSPEDKGEAIADVAIANLNEIGINGDLVVVYNKESGGRIKLGVLPRLHGQLS